MAHRQERSDPNYAEKVILTLWLDASLRRTNLGFLASSIKFAHSQGTAAWEVTLFKNLIRLNVGQVAVLDLWAHSISVYYRKPLRLPKQLGIRVDTNWRSYAAIPGPTGLCRLDPRLI